MAATTRVDEAYQQLRRAILNGEYEPGSRLNSVQLQGEYELSTGVLREVLTRLTGDGFVTAQPQRGFRVLELSAASIEQLTEVLILLETTLIRQAIEQGDLDYESDLTAAHYRLANTPHDDESGRTSEAWRAAHTEFHRRLLAGASNERLKVIAASQRDQGEIYRSWSISVGGDLHRNAASEHAELVEAVLEHDPDRASVAIQQHAERSRDFLLAVTDKPLPESVS